MRVRFWKLSGAGNDFVLLNGLPKGRSGPALARRLCDRHDGIGADGLLSVKKRDKAVHLDYWNADGSSAFCGNGSRAGAVWASENGLIRGKSFVLSTVRGTLSVRLTGKGRAEVSMPEPNDMRLERRIRTAYSKKPVVVHHVNTGVPHIVCFVERLNDTDVRNWGRELRFHKFSGKAGANADFVQVKKGVLWIRTYERGVEDETLACGTGVVAAAAVARALGHIKGRVKVRVKSGSILSVSFGSGTRLEGPAKTVFTGEIAL